MGHGGRENKTKTKTKTTGPVVPRPDDRPWHRGVSLLLNIASYSMLVTRLKIKVTI